jgi:dienelactone hydrolase
MAGILRLHSALGLGPALLDFAERLRALGHVWEAPDYYEGWVFDDEDSGVGDHVSPGRGHLFTDLGGPHADSLATASTLSCIDAFLR